MTDYCLWLIIWKCC